MREKLRLLVHAYAAVDPAIRESFRGLGIEVVLAETGDAPAALLP